MNDKSWTVHKFGGASLAGAAEYRQVAEILLADDSHPQAAVVSASFGITDRLVALVEAAATRSEAVEEGVAGIRRHHRDLARALLSEAAAADYEAALDEDLGTVAAVLEAIRLLRRAPDEAMSLVTGFGEVWSARLLASHLGERGRTGGWLHAGEVLTVRHSELGPLVLWDECRDRLAGRLPTGSDAVLVVTGYVARAEDGTPSTLGRNGSDFTASIFAVLLDAAEVVIWTNVDGVMSGDPRLISDATVIPQLSYHEAMELAYFGARVLHPSTMGPVVERDIPIYIRNSFRPHERGSRISVAGGGDGAGVKGITTIEGIALVNLEGAGMIGVPGTADRLFGALREAGISVVVISQGSSEHSICFAVPENHATAAADVAATAFRLELEQGQIQGIDVTRGCGIIAVVGDGMRGTPGVAAKLFGALGHAGVNVRAIAQGASERNISAVIDAADANRALRAVHSGFYLSPQTLSVGLVGAGLVGGALLDQLAGEIPRLRRELNLDLRIRGIMTSRRMVTAETRIDAGSWREALEASRADADLDAFAAHVHAEHLPQAVLIDCTASQDVADRYADWLGSGMHVITPNKKGNTGEFAYYRRMKEVRRAAGARYLYETTVGAGLPIIHTLRDLKETGDEILAVEGVFSGTLAYLFNLFDGSEPFSKIVREAREKGYTEPDPRDDLSGMDVARKVVILGREMGLELELGDVEVESLVPASLAAGSVDDFLAGLADHDEEIAGRQREAAAAGQVLRYVGRLDAEGRASARLEQLPADHAFAAIALTDNIVQFVTHRYSDNPLIVRGPGAGPAVTAAGVFSDLLRLASYLGANL